MIGIKKAIKSNPIRKMIYNTPPSLVGGIFLYGKIGSGKSTGMKTLAENFHDHPDRRYKIFHLWGGDRTEQLFWTLPSRDTGYWSRAKRVLKLNQEGPKQYKVNLLYPMTKNLRHKLPQLPPHVHSKIFTIPIEDVLLEDIALVGGLASQTHEYLWREALSKLKRNQNGAYLIKIFKDLGGEGNSLYKNFVHPLIKHRLLQSKNYSYNIDLTAEAKDRETITVLVLDFIDKEFRLFVLGWILRKINELIDNGKIPTRNIIMIQEAAEFFRATDDSVQPERYKIFRRYLAQYVRMGRRGMHLFMDAQSPSETRGMVDGSQDLTIFGKLVSEADKEAGTKQMYKDNLISKKQVQDLSTLNPGEYYVAESGKKVLKRYLLLPRSMFWKKGYGNFYDSVWKNLVDEWKDVRPIMDEIEDDYQNAKKEIEKTERQKIENARMLRIAKEQEAEKQRIARARKTALLRERVKQEKRKAVAEEREKTDLEQMAEEVNLTPVPAMVAPVIVVSSSTSENVKEESIKTVKDSNKHTESSGIDDPDWDDY